MAWKPLGWKCAFVSEIEPFPCNVLAHHYPDVPNLGDLTRYKEWKHEPIDLLVGGTPCQSFSVAGLRKGLDDPRGNMALVFLGLVDRARPRWVVWENVPGVLSSGKGRDFGAFLGALGQLGYGWSYRVLDAQYFGLAQRRKRVFVVGCLGGWQRAAAVLLERACLRGDPAPSREAGTRVARAVTGCPTGGQFGTGRDGQDDFVVNLAVEEDNQNGTRLSVTAGSIRSNAPGTKPGGTLALVAHSLRAEGHDASEDGTGRGTPLVADVADTLACTMGKQISRGGKEGGRVTNPIVYRTGVRRLTPRECERLQGFPDDYTAIPGAKDSPRYRALGNSMAVPVMRWIGERIAAVEAIARSGKEAVHA